MIFFVIKIVIELCGNYSVHYILIEMFYCSLPISYLVDYILYNNSSLAVPICYDNIHKRRIGSIPRKRRIGSLNSNITGFIRSYSTKLSSSRKASIGNKISKEKSSKTSSKPIGAITLFVLPVVLYFTLFNFVY